MLSLINSKNEVAYSKLTTKHFPYESTAAYGWDKEKFIEQNITKVVFITYYRIRYSIGIVRSKMAPNFDLLPILSKNKNEENKLIVTKDRPAV